MQLHPTRAAVDLTIAGIATVAVGLVAREAAIVAWGGAVLVGLAVARAVTLFSIAKIRAAGFEMLWRGEERVARVARGESVELEAEVRNRDSRAARYVQLRPVCSPNLRVLLDPTEGEVPAGGRLSVNVRIETPRVGQHGVHGLSLEVQGSPGLYEVPLTFANPFGVEVLPAAYATSLRSARGGRSRVNADSGRAGRLSGDGLDLRELREHQPGDSFKRIAWKASARRGKLMVRDYLREERDVVWLVVDASVELWAGAPGAAPLDVATDEAAAVAAFHLGRGDRVGLAVIGARELAWLEPDRGPRHAAQLMSALATSSATLDADRSDLDEHDVAIRVLEHLRPLDPAAAHGVRSRDIDRIARRAERARGRGPFASGEPFAESRRERILRRYLAAFAIGSPPRMEPERPKADACLAQTLTKLPRLKPRPSVVYLFSPAPEPSVRPVIHEAIAKFPRRRTELRWVASDFAAGLPKGGDVVEQAVGDAMAARSRIAELRGHAYLRRHGIHAVRPTARGSRRG